LRIHWIIDRLAMAGGTFAALILAAMTAAVIYDVTMRDLFNAPTLWSVEYTSYGMAWLGLLGAAEVLRRHEHVGIAVLTDRLSPVGRLVIHRLSHLVVAVTAGWLLVAGTLWTWSAYQLGEVSDTVLRTPQVLVRLAFPVGMLLVVLVSLARALAPTGGAKG
jgi:TRAP-type C4-dicarboxylate transport system permease small subunit